MRKINWSIPARDDLRRIAIWLEAEVTPDVAVRHLRAIRVRCEALEKFPKRGPQIGKEARKLIVQGTPYIILYRMIRTDIEVVRVFHNRENWRDEA